MNKIDFLNKLKKEGKIQLVDPNENIKDSYLKKSKNSMTSAEILLRNNQLEDSIVCVYYSMYNLLIGLLFKIGIKSENHTASIIFLKDIFDIDNFYIKFCKAERIDKQYYIGFSITKEQVEESIKKAKIFNSDLLNFILRINHDSLNFYRNKFKKIMGFK